jgi:hypothetical protein
VKKHFAIILFWFVAFTVKAQTYGNEWVNFNQPYFKFPVHKEGIFRIDSLRLSAYYNLATVNPKNFQLFFKGKEQFLFIKGEADNQINNGDYLEFYLNPNAGAVDSLIYTNITYVPNPYASLFNDTIYAFLTINNALNNKRYQVENDLNFSAYDAPAYFYTEKTASFSDDYNPVKEHAGGDASDPHYTQAEARGRAFAKGTSVSTSFSGLNSYTTASLPVYVSVNCSGSSISNLVSIDHELKMSYLDQAGNTVQLYDSLFRGYLPIRKNFTLSSQNIANSTNIAQSTNFIMSSVANAQLANVSNQTFLHYVHLYYPHSLSFNNESFFKLFVDNNVNSPKSHFNFSGFNPGPLNSVLLYDISNGKKIPVLTSPSQVQMVIPNGPGKKLCIMAAESEVDTVFSLFKVNQTGSFTNFKNNAGSKPYLIIYHKTLESSALGYKNYRESVAGGSYKVITASVNELYEQFGYGINKHPLSIKNFIRFLYDSLVNKPQYVLLLGKGVAQDELDNGSQALNLVPTIGYPGCDVLFTSAITQAQNNNFYSDIPIGRIAATSNAEVNAYLTKVQDHEGTGPEDWKKRVLHFVGGDTPDLSNQLEAYMDGYKQIIMDTLFGAEVFTFKKNTTAPIQNGISDSIKNIVNNGAALLSFFGHGSKEGFDQAIDDPSVFNNKGKYPFVMANSCLSGNIHTRDKNSVSENFVLIPQKGSIGFLATTSYGFPYALNNFTSFFYEALSKTRYNMGIGDIIQDAGIKNAVTGDLITRFTVLDMTLHGDPAVKITNGILPDYQVKNNDVVFNLKKYGDSLGIRINLKNSGKAISDSFNVRIERFFPNGDSIKISKKVKAPLFKDSLVFFMLLDFDRGIGLNKFTVKLDEFNEIQESFENNNSTGTIDLFVPGGDIFPVYPYKFAIVPKTTTITLKASTTDPFAPSIAYRFQLDTCDRFINPIQTALITSSGGVLRWDVTLPFSDSTVYFWRVSRDSISPNKAFAWRESSFQTIGNKKGWSQAHFHQYKNDGYQFVNYKKEQRQFVFENTEHSIKCRTGIHPNLDLSQFRYYFNHEDKSGWSPAFDGWNFAIFDSITGLPQETRSIPFNPPSSGLGMYNNCVEYGSRYVYAFGAISNACGAQATWRTDIENFLNAIPPNQYVLAYTTGFTGPNYHGTTSFNNALYTAFEKIGAKNIRTLQDTVPYILFGKKGMIAGQGHVTQGTDKKTIIVQNDSITTRWQNGYVASEIIGPSQQWNSLHWRTKSLETAAGDTTVLKVIGIKANGQMDTLKTFPKDSADVLALYNYVDAGIYPHLKLVAFMKDNVHRTSPQLKRWQVIYEQAPECAINPLMGFASINDTLQEGDDVVFRFPVENIGTENFKDSLVISYWIEDNNRNKTFLPDKLKSRPFMPGQVFTDTVKINSYLLAGNNALWIYVNPIQNSKYQKEQSSFNNIGRYPFRVNTDRANPLLDVTFDGVRILNGDIVSSKPSILITLKDENKFLALNDTGAFTVYMQAPDQTAQKRIYFAQGLDFTPASLPKNSCSILYNPVLPVDGKYALIVQARDRSRNASGSQDYRIQFEVNNKPSVTNVLNYPNPFSTSTRFVFTLTGSEVPEVFTIRIMTITGKIVREITRSELGYLHIGRNISEYAWDGRDDFGDKLANGVYLYHVITRLNGNTIDKSSTGADKFFVKEFGKMVLMR